MSEVATWLGLLQDIVVGHPEIDEPFIIQGSDKRIVTSLFGNASIRKPIVEAGQIVIALHDTKAQFARVYPVGVTELSLQLSKIIRPLDELLLLVDLFCEIKEQLHNLGVAEGIPESVA